MCKVMVVLIKSSARSTGISTTKETNLTSLIYLLASKDLRLHVLIATEFRLPLTPL